MKALATAAGIILALLTALFVAIAKYDEILKGKAEVEAAELMVEVKRHELERAKAEVEKTKADGESAQLTAKARENDLHRARTEAEATELVAKARIAEFEAIKKKAVTELQRREEEKRLEGERKREREEHESHAKRVAALEARIADLKRIEKEAVTKVPKQAAKVTEEKAPVVIPEIKPISISGKWSWPDLNFTVDIKENGKSVRAILLSHDVLKGFELFGIRNGDRVEVNSAFVAFKSGVGFGTGEYSIDKLEMEIINDSHLVIAAPRLTGKSANGRPIWSKELARLLFRREPANSASRSSSAASKTAKRPVIDTPYGDPFDHSSPTAAMAWAHYKRAMDENSTKK